MIKEEKNAVGFDGISVLLQNILQSVEQYGKNEEHDGGDEHQAGDDDGKESQFPFERADLVFGKERIGAAGNGTHIVSGPFLHNNDNDHRNAGQNHQDEERDTKSKEYVAFCRGNQAIEHFSLLIKK